MPITAQEAWEATNPNAGEDARIKSAQQIMAAVAANDAYLSSRTQIEQAIALAKGQGPPVHEDATSQSSVLSEKAKEVLAGAADAVATEVAGPSGAAVVKAAEAGMSVIESTATEIDPAVAAEVKDDLAKVVTAVEAIGKKVGL